MRLRFVILLLFFSIHSGFAQRYSFLQRGVEDGLQNPVINDLLMDKTGIIWLATDGSGLVRFDGDEFEYKRIFRRLPSQFITVLTQDNAGEFWIGTEKGLAKFDGLNLTLFDTGPQDRINAISVFEDGIWIATRKGLYKYAEGRFRLHDALKESEVLGVAQSGESLYYSTREGAFEITKGKMRKLPYGDVKRIIAIESGLVFSNSVQAFCKWGDSVFVVDVPGIRDAFLTPNHVLWLASERNGLVRVEKGVTEVIDATHGLAYDRVRSLLFVDSKLWIGSQQGLSFFQNPESFVIDASQGLKDESVHVAYKKGDEYWIGTSSGISVFTEKGKVTEYEVKDGLPPGLVLDIEVHKGEIWAATEQGVAVFRNEKFKSLTSANGFDADFVFCLKDDETSLLVGSASGAQMVFRDHAEKIPFIDSIPDGIVEIENTHRGQYFLGISGALYNSNLKGLERVHEWKEMSIDTLRVFSVKSSPKYECLLVSGDGVYLWNGSRIVYIHPGNGLPSANFKSAEFAGDRLWVSTDLGLHFIEVTPNGKQPFKVGNAADFSSINNREFNSRSLRISANSTLLNGTNNGLLVINNEAVNTNPNYAVEIQSVNLFFQSGTEWSAYADSLTSWSNMPLNLALPHDKNYLSFKFNVPPSNAYESKIFMRYKLVGQDKNWTYLEGRREAFFTSIDPGNYTFTIESALDRSFRDAQKAEFNFRIIAPYWRTIWFWIVILVLIVGVVFLGVRFRIKQLNEKLELESALADSERKALRLQMNPHFVFNALDAISGFIFKNNPKEAVRYLGSFAKLMRITLESSRETLVPLQNEVQLLKNYIDLEQLRFNNKFNYAINLEEDLDPYNAILPPMLLQPFIENAILHGLRHKEGEDGMLTIDFKDVDDHWVCTITDNGIGREASAKLNVNKQKQSLATSITQERIELLSKSLGERVSFVVTDLKSPAGEAQGTQVEITFPHLVLDEES